MSRYILGSIRTHRPKLQNFKIFLMNTNSFLSKKNRSRRIYFYPYRNSSQKRHTKYRCRHRNHIIQPFPVISHHSLKNGNCGSVFHQFPFSPPYLFGASTLIISSLISLLFPDTDMSLQFLLLTHGYNFHPDRPLFSVVPTVLKTFPDQTPAAFR